MMLSGSRSGAGGRGQGARVAATAELLGGSTQGRTLTAWLVRASGQVPCPLPHAPPFGFPLHAGVRA